MLGRVQGVAAGISGGMHGKPRAWDRDEELDLVRELDKAAIIYRKQEITRGTKDAKISNGAASILNIWNSAGSMIFNGAIAKLGIPKRRHAEQLMVDWAAKIIEAKVEQLQAVTINLTIFSQTAVCLSCLGKATTGTWKTELQVATGKPVSAVTINISLWQWGNINQPRYLPIFP